MHAIAGCLKRAVSYPLQNTPNEGLIQLKAGRLADLYRRFGMLGEADYAGYERGR